MVAIILMSLHFGVNTHARLHMIFDTTRNVAMHYNDV